MNENIKKWYDQNSDAVTALSDKLWANPESALEEFYACEVVTDFMKSQGFETKNLNLRGTDERPNTLVARWGSGKPVIGIIGEFDALSGLGNEASPFQAPRQGPGHACGHNLMAGGCAGAASAAKYALESEGLPGTVVYFGCPAEETAEGKPLMASLGLFDGLDLCVGWHSMPYEPTIVEVSTAAVSNCYIEFFGKTAHAAANPDKGRSALDAAELMNVGVQYLREHMADNMRIHYVYLAAGEKPNIVPDYANLHYFMRGRDRGETDDVVRRVRLVAEGAALMTETEMKFTVNVGCYDTIINHTFNRFLYESASKIPPLEYTAEDLAFAKELRRNYDGVETDDLLPSKLRAPTGVTTYTMGSSDTGDVSHIVPTSRIYGGAQVKDTPTHHWSLSATTGMGIGHAAELYAGKALAQCMVDAAKDPSIVEKAWAEFTAYKKDNNIAPYKSIVG